MCPEPSPPGRYRRVRHSWALPYLAASAVVLAGFVLVYVDALGGVLLVAGGAWLAPAVRGVLLGRVPLDVPTTANVLLAVLVAASGAYLVGTGPSGTSAQLQPFQSALEEQDIPTERVAATDGRWVVETRIDLNASEFAHNRARTVAIIYAGFVPESGERVTHEGLDVLVRGPEGAVVVRYAVDADHARLYGADRLSLDEYVDGIETGNETG